MYRRFNPSIINLFTTLLLIAIFFVQSPAQRSKPTGAPQPSKASSTTAEDTGQSEMRPIIEYYIADRGSLQRSYPFTISPARHARFQQFYSIAPDRIQKTN